jgi:hypothetical protein
MTTLHRFSFIAVMATLLLGLLVPDSAKARSIDSTPPAGFALGVPVQGAFKVWKSFGGAHTGTDYGYASADAQVTVVAAHDGTVLWVEPNGGCTGGTSTQSLAISGSYNGTPYYTSYGHLGLVNVRAGDVVSRGQVLGMTTSKCGGVQHVHFEFSWNEVYPGWSHRNASKILNPEQYVRDQGQWAGTSIVPPYSNSLPLYQFKSVNSDKVISVANGRNDGERVVQRSLLSTNPNQLWTLEPTDVKYYLIRSSVVGKCLDVSGGSADNGAAIILWACHGGRNQHWELLKTGDSFMIRSRSSDKVIDVPEGSKNNNVGLVQWDQNGGSNQLWRIEPH